MKKRNVKQKMAQAVSYLLILCMIMMAPLSYNSDAAVSAAELPSEDDGTNAEEGKFQAGNIWYKKLTEDTVQLTDGTAVTGEVTIPQTVTDEASQTEYTVVSIGSKAFYNNNQITKVIFPDTITDIGDNAFNGASYLQGLTLPPQLVSIGDYAFCSISRVAQEEFDLILPDTVKEIGRWAFADVRNMKSVKLPAKLKRIREYTFIDCEKLKEITFPAQLAVIESYAFRACLALTEIVLPDSVTEIQGGVFMYCAGLASITLPENLTVLEGGVFSGCTSLASIELPENLERIGTSAFQRCSSLTSVTIPQKVTRLGLGLFDNLISENLHVSITSDLTFAHAWFCSSSSSVHRCNITIHCATESSAARIWSIGHKNILLNGAKYEPNESDMKFNDERFTYSVIDPIRKLVRIDGRISGTDKFGGELVLPEKVEHNGVEYTLTEIGQSSFNSWGDLTKVVLPDTVTDIAQDAFSDCSKLEEIHLPKSLAALGSRAFKSCSALTGKLVLPESCKEIDSSVFSGTGYEEIVLPKNAVVTGINLFAGCNQLKRVTLPESMTCLRGGTFQNCPVLESVTLPKNLTVIGDYAFSNCTSLTEVVFPDSLESIGNNAFEGCTALQGTLLLKDSVVFVGSKAFSGCDNLSRIHVGGGIGILSNDALPEGVRLTAYTQKAQAAVLINTNRANGEVDLLWDGKHDVPAGMDIRVEDHLVITGSVKISADAKVTVAEGVSIRTAEGAELTVGENASLNLSENALLTIDGTLINNGEVTGAGAFQLNGSLSGEGTFGGTVNFSIALTESMIAGVQDKVYDGTSFKPEPEVSILLGTEKVIFEKGIDFTYSYAKNQMPGQAEITVTPIETGRLKGVPVTVHFTIQKAEQSAPECKISYTKNADGKTFTAVIAETAGAEYSYDGENFSENNQKADCQPNTEYTGYIRYKETETQNAGAIGHAAEKTPKLEQGVPECKISYTKNADGKTFTAVIAETAGAEYSFDGKTFGESNQKADCQPNTEYTGYIRMKETETHYTGSAAHATVKSPKLEQRAPECKISYTKNADGKTFTAVIAETAGAEYSFDGKIFSENNQKADCQPNTEYTGYIRYKETETHNAGAVAHATAKSPKLEQNAPECKISYTKNADGKTFTAVIAETAGAEYSFDGKIFSENNQKTDCQPNTEYTGYIRYKETETQNAGAIGHATEKTPKLEQNAPECKISFIKNADGKTFTAVIAETAGAEYSFDGKSFGESNQKADCQPNTEYTGYIRYKETETQTAGAVAQATAKSPKLEQNAPECKISFIKNADGKTFTAVIAETAGAEYSFDGKTFSESNQKADCQPNTEYTGYIRYKETETHNAGAIGQTTEKTPKLEQGVPECKISYTKNADGKTFTAVITEIVGAEYSYDGENFSENNTKTDCQPNTEYTGYIRYKETETQNAGAVAQATEKTPKLEQNTPECDISYTKNADGKTFTAVITEIIGAEYSFDGENFSENNTKTDCQPNTEYTGYIRMKETETHDSSQISKVTQKTPKITDASSGSGTNDKPIIPPAANPSDQKKEELAAPVIAKWKAGVSKTGVCVTITITPVLNAEYYDIYRTAGGKTIQIGKTENGKTVFQDTNPVKKADYYAVACAQGGSMKSQAGKAISVKLAGTVQFKHVKRTSNGIKLTWKKSKEAVKYVIYRSTKKNNGYKRIKTLKKKSLSFIDKKAKKGKKYYYKIAVVTKSNPSPMSKPSKCVKR